MRLAFQNAADKLRLPGQPAVTSRPAVAADRWRTHEEEGSATCRSSRKKPESDQPDIREMVASGPRSRRWRRCRTPGGAVRSAASERGSSRWPSSGGPARGSSRKSFSRPSRKRSERQSARTLARGATAARHRGQAVSPGTKNSSPNASHASGCAGRCKTPTSTTSRSTHGPSC